MLAQRVELQKAVRSLKQLTDQGEWQKQEEERRRQLAAECAFVSSRQAHTSKAFGTKEMPEMVKFQSIPTHVLDAAADNSAPPGSEQHKTASSKSASSAYGSSTTHPDHPSGGGVLAAAPHVEKTPHKISSTEVQELKKKHLEM